MQRGEGDLGESGQVARGGSRGCLRSYSTGVCVHELACEVRVHSERVVREKAHTGRMHKVQREISIQGVHSTERRRLVTRTAWHAFWPVRPRVLVPEAQGVHLFWPVVLA